MLLEFEEFFVFFTKPTSRVSISYPRGLRHVVRDDPSLISSRRSWRKKSHTVLIERWRWSWGDNEPDKDTDNMRLSCFFGDNRSWSWTYTCKLWWCVWSLYISTDDIENFLSQRHLGQWRQFSERRRGKGNILSCCCCGEIVMISFGLNRWLIRSYSNSLQVVTFDLVSVPDQPLKKYKTATTTGVLGSSSSRMWNDVASSRQAHWEVISKNNH